MNTQPTMTIEVPMPASLLDKCTEQPILLWDILPAEQKKKIEAFVVDHLENQDGAPQLDNIGMTKFRYDETDRNGSFRLHFYINRRFCCSDTESSRSDYLDFHFSYEQETVRATATYLDWNVL